MVRLAYDMVAPKVHFVPISRKNVIFNKILLFWVKKSTDGGAGHLFAVAGEITLYWSTTWSHIWHGPEKLTAASLPLRSK